MSNLKIIELKKSFFLGEKEIPVLKSLSVEFPLQKIITIMGASGSGKSTFMHILSGVDKSDSGKILLGEIELNSLNEKELTKYRREKIGIIFQFFNLLPYLSSLENVSIPLYLAGVSKKEAHKKAIESLESVGLEKRIHHKPSELSGGEQQRIAIARAIVNDPEFIFADEPTGNLDSENSDKILNLLKSLQEKKKFSIFMVTHNPEIGKAGDIQVQMKDGNLI